MEKFSHPEETIPTMYVDRGGVPFRINVASYDGKETVYAGSHFIPDGAPVAGQPVAPETPATPPKVEKSGKATKVEPVVAPAQNFVVGPDADGKFWRTDAAGVKLIETAFDTSEAAAAAVIPA